jgi:hypothetical protein
MSRPAEDLPDGQGHRRRTARQVRHSARAALRTAVLDEDTLEDADAVCPTGKHDLGRKASPRPPEQGKPGRRPGFKVWKTPFWKRRRALWASRNEAQRRLG